MSQPLSEQSNKIDDYDVIVLGGGVGGMAAAVFAALDGARVALLERSEYVGGTSALSAGSLWIPNTRHSVAVGLADSLENAGAFLDAAVGELSPRALRDAFLRAGPLAVERLEQGSSVKFRARPLHPDYLDHLPGATRGGRAIEAQPFDAAVLGPALRLLRPPIPEFTVFGGMMVDRDDIGHLLKLTKSFASLRHALRLVGKYAVDKIRFGRGARLVMGNALAARLLKSMLDLRVTVMTQAQVTDIDGDESARVVSFRRGGNEFQIRARGGVILASGGFARHPDRRVQFMPSPVPEYSPSAPGNTGELHDLALKLGAQYGQRADQPVFWAPVSVRPRKDGSHAVFPHFVLDRSKPGIITVNRHGRRFVNESTSYHRFVIAMYEANGDGSAIPAFELTDARGIRKYGLGLIRPGGGGLEAFVADGYLTRAETLQQLAGELGIDADALAETVQRMNRFAVSGIDEDFARGTTPYEQVNGDPAHGPNPTLGQINEPPFYAIRLWPGEIGAAIGLRTDEHARLLDSSDHPIAGLYACGNDMHSIMGGVYPGPGINLGPALVFAYQAARDAVARCR